ncbi:hypothetical protein L596_009899 [Steinernema carpocapsae]|uniref:Uncharacterized protein n=1 Tax=Steinernema carpocapsae TaxID=34508 RepID=A0A4V6A6V7_STECR|nr:hypothetical protein L596_009899 [Steinernema carpocapsae]
MTSHFKQIMKSLAIKSKFRRRESSAKQRHCAAKRGRATVAKGLRNVGRLRKRTVFVLRYRINMKLVLFAYDSSRRNCCKCEDYIIHNMNVVEGHADDTATLATPLSPKAVVPAARSTVQR